MIPLPGGAFLGDDELLALAALVPPAQRWWDRNGLPMPRELREPVAALERYPAQRGGGSVVAASDPPPIFDRAVSASPGSSWLSTTETAELIGVGVRSVVDACRRGTLRARQDGPGCAWLIDPASARQYAERRARRGRPLRLAA